MPSLVGNININSIGSSGVVSIGDTFYVSPKSTSKTFSGAGSFNTGNLVNTASGASSTNTMDSDLLDSSNAVNK